MKSLNLFFRLYLLVLVCCGSLLLPSCKEEVEVPSTFSSDIRINLYPSPVATTGQLTLSIAHTIAINGRAILRDFYGAEAKTIPFSFPEIGTNSIVIPVTGLSEGAYTVEIQVNDRTKLFSVIVKP
jgi:hypothetical protein